MSTSKRIVSFRRSQFVLSLRRVYEREKQKCPRHSNTLYSEIEECSQNSRNREENEKKSQSNRVELQGVKKAKRTRKER